jgi:hypothetical protein
MNLEKNIAVHIVIINLDMLPTDEEIEKVIKLSKKYTMLNVPQQQRINMFDYIKQHWND